MKGVAMKNNILRVSSEFDSVLQSTGCREHFPSAHVLFEEEGKNDGVFLVCKGKVLLGIRSLPKFDRVFSAGSLLGLPSTFGGRPYSLTAITKTRSEVVHVAREDFLQLMHDCPDLCREATDTLGREVRFIKSALAKRHRQLAKVSSSESTVRPSCVSPKRKTLRLQSSASL